MSEYVLDLGGERKGFGKRDKYKTRFLRLTADGVFQEFEKKKIRVEINMKKDDYSDIKINDNENKKGKCKSTWEITYGGKVHDYASADDAERSQWIDALTKLQQERETMNKEIEESGAYDRDKPDNDDFKEIQYIFDNSSSPEFTKPKERTKAAAKCWKEIKKDPKWKQEIYILKKKHLAGVDGLGAAGGDDEKSEPAPKKKGGFGGFGGLKNKFGGKGGDDKKDEAASSGAAASGGGGSEAKYAEEEEEPTGPAANGNINPLKKLKLAELMSKDIGTFRTKLGAVMDDVRFDVVASNEFCNIVVGMGLVKEGEGESEGEEDDEEDEDDKKSSARFAKENDDDDVSPDVYHDGTIGKAITFNPEDRNFTFSAEFKCKKIHDDNVIFSDKEYEIIAPRPTSNRAAIRWVQTKKPQDSPIRNCGDTELFEGVWYHLVVVVYRPDEEDKRPTSQFRVYLNGVPDGELSVKKESGGMFGGLFGKKKKSAAKPLIGQNPHSRAPYRGELRNIKVFYRALTEEQVAKLAYNTDCNAYIPPRVISYKQESLKVAVPACDIKYNGPIRCLLPNHQQDILKPDGNTDFTITAYILIARTGSQGSVILSNWDKKKKRGFSFFGPMAKSNVLGFRCSSGSSSSSFSQGSTVDIGTKQLQQNRWYHVAISIKRRIGEQTKVDQTMVAVYINGKMDGSYTYNGEDTNYDYISAENKLYIGTEANDGSAFQGDICNLRVYKDQALTEGQVAAVYAADIKARKFRKNDKILVAQRGISNGDKDATSNKTVVEGIEWTEGTFQSQDKETGKGKADINGKVVEVAMNEIIKPEADVTMIDGSESTRVETLGGLIEGVDFNDKPFKIFSNDSTFLRYICTPSALSSLCQIKPFPKYKMELMIANENIDNTLLLNRCLFAAYELLKDINVPELKKKYWNYFNEFILPWKVWEGKENFEKLKVVARTLQKPIKDEQYALFDRLKAEAEGEKPGNKLMLELTRKPHDTIKNRQDKFDGGMTTECDESVWPQDKVLEYDRKVSTMMVWGRNMVLEKAFQTFMKTMYEDKDHLYHYVAGPIKTYERMMEKAKEYKEEDNAAHPAAYRITDVLRCSIKCETLELIHQAFQILVDKMTIIRIKNRFYKDFNADASGGYRDMLVNVLFKDDACGLSAICEVQFHMNEYAEIKGRQHRYYKIDRALNYKTLLRNYEARKFDDKKKKDNKH